MDKYKLLTIYYLPIAFKDEIADMYNTDGPKPKPKSAPANPGIN